MEELPHVASLQAGPCRSSGPTPPPRCLAQWALDPFTTVGSVPGSALSNFSTAPGDGELLALISATLRHREQSSDLAIIPQLHQPDTDPALGEEAAVPGTG